MQINTLIQLQNNIDSLLDGSSIKVEETLANAIKIKVKELFKLGRTKEGIKKVEEIYKELDNAKPLNIKDFVALSNTKIKIVALEEQLALAKAKTITEDDISDLYKKFFTVARSVIDDESIDRSNILLTIRDKIKVEL
jgi:rRNA maturation endonuclease Nob1